MKVKITAKQKAIACADILRDLYPDALCSLREEQPFRLLVSVRLSAQCTDARVNEVTPALFERYPTVEAFAEAEISELESYVHSCGFFRAKAHDIKAAAQMLLSEYGGELPCDMDKLLALPGVGRKSANLLLGDVFGQPAVVADTHCIRISNRLGLAKSKDPYKVEMALKKLLPPEGSNDFCHRLVLFGRDTCRARGPLCENCPLAEYCIYADDKEK